MLATEPEASLREELAALRAELAAMRAALERRVSVSLQADRRKVYLGQPVLFTVTARTGDGRPAPNVRLTLTTTWGELAATGALSGPPSASLTLHTGADGTARVRLQPRTAEPLWADQQQALEEMLTLLDADAPTPRETGTGLEEMVRLYRLEESLPLRRGMDIYFRSFGKDLHEAVNDGDPADAWACFDATLLAYAHLPGSETEVAGAAAFPLRLRDWLGPWLETFRRVADGESALNEQLNAALAGGLDAGQLVENVFGRIRDYVEVQPGLAGEFVGRRVIGRSIQGIVERDLSRVSAEAQAAVLPVLVNATGTLHRAGVDVLSGLAQARSGIRSEVEVRLQPVQQIKERLGTVETSLSGKADQTQVDRALATKVDFGGLNDALAGKVDRTRLEEVLATKLDRTALNEALATKADQAVVERVAQDLRGTLAAADTRLTGLERDAGTRATRKELNEALAGRVTQSDLSQALATRVTQADLTQALSTRVSQTDLTQALATKASITDLNTFRTQVNASLQTKLNATDFNAFRDTEYRVFREKVEDRIGRTIDRAALDQAIAGIQAETRQRLDQAVTKELFTTFQDQVNGSLARKAEQTQIEVLRRDVVSDLGRVQDTVRVIKDRIRPG